MYQGHCCATSFSTIKPRHMEHLTQPNLHPHTHLHTLSGKPNASVIYCIVQNTHYNTKDSGEIYPHMWDTVPRGLQHPLKCMAWTPSKCSSNGFPLHLPLSAPLTPQSHNWSQQRVTTYAHTTLVEVHWLVMKNAMHKWTWKPKGAKVGYFIDTIDNHK